MLRAIRYLVAVLLTVAAGASFAGTQLIVPSPTSSSLTPGSDLAIQVRYNSIAPADNTLRGLSFRMHWDSRRLTFVSTAGVLSTNLVAITATP